MNLNNHLCFNNNGRLKHCRVRLPVAPRCNVQYKFSFPQSDCANESRLGLINNALSPGKALTYLNQVMQQRKDISVVSIAGPGDPFASPDETLETLNLVRATYPAMLLCLATNGLNLPPYIFSLVNLNLSHITITVNALDPKIGSQIYSWVRYGKRIYRGEEAAQILIENQLTAIARMKAHGIIVKINTIIIGGINDLHAEDIAKKMTKLKVDIHNFIPTNAVDGSVFTSHLKPNGIFNIQMGQASDRYISQVDYCPNCFVNDVDLLGETIIPNSKQTVEPANFPSISRTSWEEVENIHGIHPTPSRPYFAVISREGVLVNHHLFNAEQIYIYVQTTTGINPVSIRPMPKHGSGSQRWLHLANLISDCYILLVNGIDPSPKQILIENGLQVFEVEGLISEIMDTLQNEKSIFDLAKDNKVQYPS